LGFGRIILYAIAFIAAILLDLGVVLGLRHYRRRRGLGQVKASAPPPEADAPAVASPPSFDLGQLPAWAAVHWRELTVALVLMAILAYVWIITPRDVVPLQAADSIERPPLAGLYRVWRFVVERLSTWLLLWPVVSLSVMLGLGGVGWWTGRWGQGLQAATLFGLFSLGLEGELFFLYGDLGTGFLLCGLVLFGFGAWMIVCRPAPQGRPVEDRRMGRLEWVLVLFVVVLAAFARFYALSRIPYGIEGDESKWTVEVASVMVDGRHAIRSEYHYATQPLSFYMQAPFHHLLGPGILSARIAVATYSLIATMAFYWLVRQTLGPRVALLATVLLSVSIADVSASRSALVEAHVKVWAVVGLAFLAHGLRVGRPVYSFVGGVALALGLLTYDTFVPMIAVAVIWTVISLVVRRASLQQWVVHLVGLLLPVAIVTPTVVEYLVGRAPYYERSNPDLVSIATLWENLLGTLRNFWLAPGDFLFVRHGPLVNALLIPFLLLGFILSVSRPRRPGYVLPALWFALLFFPVPILTGHPQLRVFYSGFPAVYVLISLGMLLVWREVTSALPVSLWPGLVAVAGLALVGLVLLNLFLYFNTVIDSTDRQVRRELMDLVTEGITPGRRVYVPYFADSEDIPRVEQPLFLLGARRRLPRDRIEAHLWMGPYQELLPALSREGVYFEDVAVVVSHLPPTQADQDDQSLILDALEQCAGGRLEYKGRWFSLYVLDAFSLQEARCVAPRVRLEGPFPVESVSEDRRLELRWRMEDAAGPAEVELECQQLSPDVVVVEAEDMRWDSGWDEDRRLAPGFRGRSCLADRTTVDDAYVAITFPLAGTYTLWTRVYRQSPDTHPLHLVLDGRAEKLVYKAGDPLSQWVWKQVGDFYLGAGIHTLRMARPVQDTTLGTRPLCVDTFLFSADPSFDPQVESEWTLSLESRDAISAGTSSGAFQLDGLLPGSYRCWVTLADGGRLLDWNGQVGARSNTLHFVVDPGEEGE